MSAQVTGVVRWFQAAKGYGFISPDSDPTKDIFVHFSNINMNGYKNLEEGQRVRFELYAGDKGPIAQNVEVV